MSKTNGRALRNGSTNRFTSFPSIFYPKTTRQREALQVYAENDIIFYVGPAGTGKTYVAMAIAIQELISPTRKSPRTQLILTRPAIEAGEKLGFLPGDKEQKVEPYLQPLQDSADKILKGDPALRAAIHRLTDIVPLAYMRGRTFDHSICILDEAQNATRNQIKMFLTRAGENAKMIVCGDTDQTDLCGPNALERVYKRFQTKPRVGVIEYQEEDIVRNSIIKMVLETFREIDRDED